MLQQLGKLSSCGKELGCVENVGRKPRKKLFLRLPADFLGSVMLSCPVDGSASSLFQTVSSSPSNSFSVSHSQKICSLPPQTGFSSPYSTCFKQFLGGHSVSKKSQVQKSPKLILGGSTHFQKIQFFLYTLPVGYC